MKRLRDFRRRTDAVDPRATCGDALYNKPAADVDALCARIRLPETRDPGLRQVSETWGREAAKVAAREAAAPATLVDDEDLARLLAAAAAHDACADLDAYA